MKSDRLERLESLFHEARALTEPREREALLRATAREDSELAAEVESLLEHDSSPRPSAQRLLDDDREDRLVGRRVDGYLLLERVGAGGMATVFRAEQSSPRRCVALKVMRASLRSRSARARFEREIRLLGALEHPNIARIHGAGVVPFEDGTSLPYFAMEFVDGIPLDQYAAARGLSPETRMALVALVADAVHHAHQRGVIHRDLKPANVLVCDGPGQCADTPRPKVLDFGVARAVSHEEERAGRETTPGQIVGTLAYMSPEQVAGKPEAQDVRSDVYSLGVLLYELLTGELPHDVQGVPLLEAARRIQRQVPARPSTIDRRLRGDVDRILLTALASDPDARYQSAAALADDLRRHLAGRPIRARSKSHLYVLGKLLVRHRLAVAATLTGLFALVAFAVVAAREARENRRLAEELGRSSAHLDRELFRSELERGMLFTRLGGLAAAEEVLWPQLFAQPDSEDALWALRDLYHRFPCLATTSIPSEVTWSLALHPDGRHVFGAAKDGHLRRHRLSDLSAIVVGAPLTSQLAAVAVSEQANVVAHLGSEGTLMLYDLDTLELVHRWDEAGLAAPGLIVTPDGGRLLVGGTDGVLRVFDLAERVVVDRLEAHAGHVTALAAAPNGNLATGGVDGRLVLRPSLEAAPSSVFVDAHRVNVSALAFAPDAATLASGGRDKTIHVWDLERGQRTHTLSGALGTVRWLAFRAEDPGRLLSGGWWSLDEWNLVSGERTTRIPLPTDTFVRVPGGLDVVASHGSTVRLWDVRVLDGPRERPGLEGRCTARFSPSGDRWLVGDEEGRARLSSEDGHTAVLGADAGANRLVSVALTERTAWLAEIDSSGLGSAAGLPDQEGHRLGWARCVDLDDDVVRVRLDGLHAVSASSLALDPTGTHVVLARGDALELRDAVAGTLVRELATLTGEVIGCSFDAAGRRLAVVARDGDVHLLDLESDARWTLPTRRVGRWTAAFSADGARLAVTHWTGDVELWHLAEPSLERVLRGHRATVWDASFHPRDATLLATASADGTVRLWDAVGGRVRMVLEDLADDEALSADFDASGERLLLAGTHGRVLRVDLRQTLRCLEGNLQHQLALREAAVPSEVLAVLRDRLQTGPARTTR